MNSSRSDDNSKSAVGSDRSLLDRSRARLRVPTDLLKPAMEVARVQAMAHLHPGATASVSGEDRDALSGLMIGDELDPIATELLQVVGEASLLVAVDVSYGVDSSSSTIWATPRQAVTSSPVDPAQIDLGLVAVSQLPQVLAQMVVLQSPIWIGDQPISVGVQTLSKAVACSSRDEAATVLAEDGLNTEQAILVLDLQLPEVRRWRINSSWSTESEPETAELTGLDAGRVGQWLEVVSSSGEGEPGFRTFTPLGHGEGMSALRTVLPRNWMGTPLKPRSS